MSVDAVERRWPRRVAGGWRLLRRDPAAAFSRLRLHAGLLRLRIRNRWSRRAVTGSADVVVNLTSFGHRIHTVHYAVESIARGSARPRRLILWLDDARAVAHPPAELARLQRRGLEILLCQDFGPHKKQYPWALTDESARVPLAVADDDVIYPRWWLAGLIAANAAHPEVVNGYRAHTVVLNGDSIAPYGQWSPRSGTSASFAAFCTGVSGVIYPVALIGALRECGEAFRERCPTADDVWVHAISVRYGVRTRQVTQRQQEFTTVPGTQRGTLFRINVKDGGNDRQIHAAYGETEIQRIRVDA